jgi:hypothetical protein
MWYYSLLLYALYASVFFGAGFAFGWFGVRKRNLVMFGFSVFSLVILAKVYGFKTLLVLVFGVIAAVGAWLGIHHTKVEEPVKHLTLTMVATTFVLFCMDAWQVLVYLDSPL